MNVHKVKELVEEAESRSNLIKGKEQIEALKKLDEKYEEYLSALKWCFPEDQYAFQRDIDILLLGIELLGKLGTFFWMRGHTKQVLPLYNRISLQTQSLSDLPKLSIANLYFSGLSLNKNYQK